VYAKVFPGFWGVEQNRYAPSFSARYKGTRFSFFPRGLVPVGYDKPSDATMSSFAYRAYQTMYPGFRTDLDLAVSIAELSDIGRLVSFAANSLKQLRQLPKSLRKLTAKEAVRGASHKAAESHITYAFGIAPIISDVIGTYDALSNFQKRIDDFLARSGKPQKRRYYELGDKEVTQTTQEDYRRYVHEQERRLDFFATMSYTYEAPDLSSLSQKIKVLRDMLGLNVSLQTLWELIPFSFAFDWLLNVGNFLEQFEEPNIKVKLKMTDFSVSYKLTRKVTSSVIFFSHLEGLKDGPYYEQGDTVYCRRHVSEGELSGYSGLQTGHFGQNQLVLSTSLSRLLIGR
jgi:hypothetical protein